MLDLEIELGFMDHGLTLSYLTPPDDYLLTHKQPWRKVLKGGKHV